MTVDRGSDSPFFGDLLRQHRLAAGLTQEELAERAGMSARGISDLERGARSHPHRETVRLLADALGLSGAARSTFVRAAPRAIGRTAARPAGGCTAPGSVDTADWSAQGTGGADALLRDDAVRLVTLTGPGGVGKTRLALAVAEQLGDAFPDGRVFVDLAPLRDPALVLSHVATTLGLRESAGRAVPRRHPRLSCASGRCCCFSTTSSICSQAAPVVADLLAAGPQVKVLATSRAPLRVRGEREYPVPVLRLPTPEDARDLTVLAANEAVAFFVDRAQAVQPDFALTPDNAAAVIEICQRLDGLPLALELAAARVKVLPPASPAGPPRRAAPAPDRGTRDAPERQRTLRDAIAWSYDLLGPAARRLFRRLGVFVGGWTLEAAEAVANLEGDLDVLEGLSSLADLSLIRLDESGPEPRYGMLETIREFAQEKLRQHMEEEVAVGRCPCRVLR